MQVGRESATSRGPDFENSRQRRTMTLRDGRQRLGVGDFSLTSVRDFAPETFPFLCGRNLTWVSRPHYSETLLGKVCVYDLGVGGLPREGDGEVAGSAPKVKYRPA